MKKSETIDDTAAVSTQETGRVYRLTCRFTQDSALFEMEDATVDTMAATRHPQTTQAPSDELNSFLANPWTTLYNTGFIPERTLRAREFYALPVRYLITLSREFAKTLRARLAELEFLREKIELPCPESFLLEAQTTRPFALGQEFLDDAWFIRYWERLCSAFRQDILNSRCSAEDYLKYKNPDEVMYGRVYFHLVENRELKDEAPFAFMATFAMGTPDGKRVQQLPLQKAVELYRDALPSMVKLLSQVSRAAKQSAFIDGLMRSGDLFHAIRLTADEVYTFLKEIPLYEQSGIYCRIPEWWRKKTQRPALTVNIGSKAPSGLGLTALLDFDMQLCANGQPLTREELQQLLLEAEGLRMLKGRWVEVDHERLRRLLMILEQQSHGSLSLLDAMRLQDSIGVKTEDDDIVSHSQGEWLAALQAKLLNPALCPLPAPGDGFRAQLRPYQQLGYQWLSTASQLGLGVCLADDMGLGKTVQMIALLSSMHSKAQFFALIIVPASLIGNWQNELARFAPHLSVRTLSGTPAHIRQVFQEHPQAEVSITSYGQARVSADIAAQHWNLLVLDEAQAIKNPASLQTRAVKKLQSAFRVAMTGTPIENRLSDLWSLFDFLNPGLLGNKTEFARFCAELEDNNDRYAQLRRTVSPFILRRLKTDRSIIDDLPEKVEVTRYAPLTKKQMALYQDVVRQAGESLEQTEGIQRKGLVLSTLLKLKQICNHGDQYLGQTAFLPEESGKMMLLSEICETIREKRERVLVFTQFREMCAPLDAALGDIFGSNGLVLHGGTPIKERQKIVDIFNGDSYVPYMVLSIKAGGVGLNLTSANHVVHFDRWWNPAVENQATDRAFRIGQKRSVMVYKMVVQGTVEEKIDKIIAEKQALSQEILSFDAHSALTELSTDALRQLFRLEEEGPRENEERKAAGKTVKASIKKRGES